MIDYTIPMIIGVVLAFALGAVVGALWGLSRYKWLRCRVTAWMMQRMREAMKSLGIEEWKIDKAQEYMGSVIIPPYIPMPEPPAKAEGKQEEDPVARMTYLTRAWLIDHGWEPTSNYPLSMGSHDCIGADLCVMVDYSVYMIAKFHHMGDKAWEQNAMPDSFELVGMNNSAELHEYDHTRLVMAAYACNITGFKQIDTAIGGVYEMTMSKKE